MLNQLAVRWQLFKRWLIFYRRATRLRHVRNPFVLHLGKALFQDKRWFYAFSDAAGLRDYIYQNHQLIPQSQFGAGSQIIKDKQVRISDLGRTVAVDAGNGQLLFRLVNYLKPTQMLEMGTSLGLSAVYQAAAAQDATFHTIEGSPAIAQLAKGHLQGMKFKNMKYYQGSFDEVLPKLLPTLPQLDYVYLDGDHSHEPTLRYFEICLPYLNEQSAFVVADIYWSPEMMEAWQALQAHPSVTFSVDFYDFGVLFFRKTEEPKQHFSLIPSAWRPWI
ncbi:MAG: class I SAM-dependent methyltransferase [Saprospiraceae bacterium]|nr:class I SAM-dependent methyltransferase [Saprospiraceae bacterium]